MKENLTQGAVVKTIVNLAIPIVGVSFLQFAYNFVDMIWVGKLGSDAVAAVGTSGFYMHLGWALSSILVVGASISVSHAIGGKKELKARRLAHSAWFGMLLLMSSYVLFIQFGYQFLIGFFELNDLAIETQAHAYLRWVALGIVFASTSQLFAGQSHARGDTKTPFKVISLGVLLNMALDPIFIFTLDMGVVGAAKATLVAQFVSATVFWFLRWRTFLGGWEDWKVKGGYIRKIILLGFPPSTQRIVFSLVAIVMARIVSEYGGEAIAAQKIGHQIEALSFMMLGGFAGAISVFTGQNYGARIYHRIKEGYEASCYLIVVVGGLMSALFLLFPEQLVRIFIQDPEVVQIGSDYLRIIGLSQIFGGLEMMTSGLINGLGKTKIPATLNVSMTVLRIPLALWLSQPEVLGVNGVWWAIMTTTITRGVLATIAYHILKKDVLKERNTNGNETKKVLG